MKESLTHQRQHLRLPGLLIVALWVAFAPVFATTADDLTVCQKLKATLAFETSPVKDQCAASACWAFPTTSNLENIIKQKHGKDIILAVDYIYVKNLIDQARSIVTKKGRAPNPDKISVHDFFKYDESHYPEKAYKMGAIPEVVLRSRIIATSRREFDNQREQLLHRLYQIMSDYRDAVKSSTNGLSENEINSYLDRLNQLERKSLKFAPGVSRTNDKGEITFRYEREWFTPVEFTKRYILRTSSISTKVIYNNNWSSTQKEIAGQLSKKNTLTASLFWDSSPKYSWYHQNLRIPSGGHAVEIVGLKIDPTTSKTESYTIKNSWGVTFGEDGFIDIPAKDLNVALNAVMWVEAGT